MKGFIEVTQQYEDADDGYKRKEGGVALINVNHLSCLTRDGTLFVNESKYNGLSISCKETYDELKAKIAEAKGEVPKKSKQEMPKGMIDGGKLIELFSKHVECDFCKFNSIAGCRGGDYSRAVHANAIIRFIHETMQKNCQKESNNV